MRLRECLSPRPLRHHRKELTTAPDAPAISPERQTKTQVARARAAQFGSNSCRTSQQEFSSRCQNLIAGNSHKTRLRLSPARVRRNAFRAAQHDAFRAKGPVARRIRGAKNCDDWYL